VGIAEKAARGSPWARQVDDLPDVRDLAVARGMWQRQPVHCVAVPGPCVRARIITEFFARRSESSLPISLPPPLIFTFKPIFASGVYQESESLYIQDKIYKMI
jgi:hypothetical protein